MHSPQKVGFDPSIDINNLPKSIVSEEKSILYADYFCACGKSVSEAGKKTYVNNLSKDILLNYFYLTRIFSNQCLP